MKPNGKGTSNIGIFGGKDDKPAGDATNVVTDYAYLKGEARSPEAAFATQITLGFKEAFAKAKGEVKDASGATAEVKFDHAAAYPPFNWTRKARSSSTPPRRSHRSTSNRPMCSRMAASMPIGWTSTAFRPSPSERANTRSTP